MEALLQHALTTDAQHVFVTIEGSDRNRYPSLLLRWSLEDDVLSILGSPITTTTFDDGYPLHKVTFGGDERFLSRPIWILLPTVE